MEMYNFILPTLYHSIKVYMRDGTSRVEKVYKFTDGSKGEEWWMTWRYQLEAFVDRLKGRTPQTWVDGQDSVANMEWIEKIYAKVILLQSNVAVTDGSFIVDWAWQSSEIFL